MTITPEQIAETVATLRRLLAAATPGPWWNESGVVHAPHPNGKPGAACHPLQAQMGEQDAELAVALRNAAPGILDALEQAQAEAARLRAAAGRIPRLTEEEIEEIATGGVWESLEWVASAAAEKATAFMQAALGAKEEPHA